MKSFEKFLYFKIFSFIEFSMLIFNSFEYGELNIKNN